MKTFRTGHLTLLCISLIGQVGCASAPPEIAGDWRPVLEACPGMKPLLPIASMPGTTRVQLSAELREGRVIQTQMRFLQGIADRRAQRSAVAAIEGTLRTANCPGVSKLRADVVLGPQQAGFQSVQLER